MHETWICIYDPETKENSKEWTHLFPHLRKFKTKKSLSKVLAPVFLDKDGIVLVDYKEKGAAMLHFTN
jgi:hypothetical protein